LKRLIVTNSLNFSLYLLIVDPKGVIMGEKSKGNVNKKKPATKSLKEKRAAKQEKKAAKANRG
jgi:hypothetical protein